MEIILQKISMEDAFYSCENQDPYCGGDNGACHDTSCLGDGQDTGDCTIGA